MLPPISLDCLKDRDTERPSDQQLCTVRVSVRAVETRSTAIRGLQLIIESQMRRLDEKELAMREKDETMAAEQQY
jgi:hypothetical protein